jgi:hypothetical protein
MIVTFKTFEIEYIKGMEESSRARDRILERMNFTDTLNLVNLPFA